MSKDVKRLWVTCLSLWALCIGAAALMDTAGCTDQLPSETSDGPIAGAAATQALSLPVCYTHNARTQAADSASAIMFDQPRSYCENLSGYANCYDGPSPFYGRRWFQLKWNIGVGSPISSQAAELWLPQGSLPAVHTYNMQCSCTSCTAHRLVP